MCVFLINTVVFLPLTAAVLQKEPSLSISAPSVGPFERLGAIFLIRGLKPFFQWKRSNAGWKPSHYITKTLSSIFNLITSNKTIEVIEWIIYGVLSCNSIQNLWHLHHRPAGAAAAARRSLHIQCLIRSEKLLTRTPEEQSELQFTDTQDHFQLMQTNIHVPEQRKNYETGDFWSNILC